MFYESDPNFHNFWGIYKHPSKINITFPYLEIEQK